MSWLSLTKLQRLSTSVASHKVRESPSCLLTVWLHFLDLLQTSKWDEESLKFSWTAEQQQNLPGLLGTCQHCIRTRTHTRCMCTEHRFASASRQLLRGQTQPRALTVLQTPLIPGCSRVAGCRLGVNTDAWLRLSCTKLSNYVFFSQRQTYFQSVSGDKNRKLIFFLFSFNQSFPSVPSFFSLLFYYFFKQ